MYGYWVRSATVQLHLAFANIKFDYQYVFADSGIHPNSQLQARSEHLAVGFGGLNVDWEITID